jgi:citrate lyase subunit beta/citryl-CoA lyase
MNLRSLLFVPGDRPDRFAKAAASGADAIILDLEDSVSSDRKADAVLAVADYLKSPAEVVRCVRINPIDSGRLEEDLRVAAKADIVVLPKAEGAQSIHSLLASLPNCPLILPIATETPAAIFTIGQYAALADQLCGLTWGAEDLPAAIGAETSRESDGEYTAPYQFARTLTLFGAHAAGVAAIETVFPALGDPEALRLYAARGARDGFTGMMALHPCQIATINAAFTPSPEAIEKARSIVAAFAASPGHGALKLDGKMVDAPHLKQALSILNRMDVNK